MGIYIICESRVKIYSLVKVVTHAKFSYLGVIFPLKCGLRFMKLFCTMLDFLSCVVTVLPSLHLVVMSMISCSIQFSFSGKHIWNNEVYGLIHIYEGIGLGHCCRISQLCLSSI